MKAPFLDLLNSDMRDWRGAGRHEDLLDNREWVTKFLAKWSFGADRTLAEEDLDSLKELRSLLRHLLYAARSEESYYENDLSRLNSIFAGAPLRRQLTVTDTFSVGNKSQNTSCAQKNFELSLSPVSKNMHWILAEIAASFASLLATGDPLRLKICENPDCTWVFYDLSKGKTRRWCDSRACGNLMKVRRFRARRKSPANKEDPF